MATNPKISSSLLGNKNAAGPHKKSLTAGAKTAGGWARDTAITGAITGGIQAAGYKVPFVKPPTNLIVKRTAAGIASGALKGSKASLRSGWGLPLAAGLGAASYGLNLYNEKQKQKNSIKGRLTTAKQKIQEVVSKAKKTVKKAVK